jgi:hypothetical protein
VRTVSPLIFILPGLQIVPAIDGKDKPTDPECREVVRANRPRSRIAASGSLQKG